MAQNTPNNNPGISPDGIPAGGGIPAQPEPTLPVEPTTPPPAPAIKAEPETHLPGNQPKYDEDDKTTFDDFKKMFQPPAPVEPTEPKADDKKKEDEVPLTEPKKEDNTPPTPPVQTPATPPNPNARDYTGLDETEVMLFKNMNNYAFAKLKPMYLEHKKSLEDLKQKDAEIAKLKQGGLPESYFEHPEAYRFDPEYQRNAAALGIINDAVAHWRKQMENIESGNDWQDLAWDDATKSFKTTDNLPANSQNRIAVLTRYQQALQQQGIYGEKVQTLQSNYLSRHAKIKNELIATEESWFPEFKDDKAPHTVIANQIRTKMPAYVQANPLAGILSKALATSLSLMQKLQGMEIELTKLKAAAPAPAAVRQPTAAELASGSPKVPANNGDDVTFDDFIKRKQMDQYVSYL